MWRLTTGLGLLISLCSVGAVAAEPDDASRAGAREMGYAGVQAYEDGNFAVAVDKLSRAFAVIKVPTLGLWLARSLARSGKLVEAGERYLEVTRLDASASDAVQRKAQTDAESEYAQLGPRIPSLLLDASGVDRNQVSVTIDGTPVPSAFLGEKRRVNPGTHEVVLTHQGKSSKEIVRVVEGENKTVTLELPSQALESGAPAAGSPAPPSAAAGSVPVSARDRSPGGGLRTFGWVSVGVGAVGLGVGGVAGLLAMSKGNELDCPDNSCTTDRHDQVASYNSLRTVSSVGFIGGAVFAAAGGVILFTAPRAPATHGRQLVPILTVDQVGLRGTF